MITGVDLISDSLAIMLDGSGGGSAVLDEKTITDNGVYYPRDETPRLDGYNKVTVNVETYEEEHEEIIDKIHERDPDYDPEDPTAPTIPEKIGDLFGFKLPFPPVSPVTPTDPDPIPVITGGEVVDENLNVSLYFNMHGTLISTSEVVGVNGNKIANPPYKDAGITLYAKYIRNGREVKTILFSNSQGINDEGEYFELQNYNVDSNGNITATLHKHLYGWHSGALDWYDAYESKGPYNIPEFVGFGNADHIYKVYNV